LFFFLLPPLTLAGPGFDDGVDAYRAGAYERALRIFQERAAKGFGDANYMLSVMYANGQGVPTDPVKSREQALIAAERNTTEAIGIVATLYFTGAFGEPNVAKGMEWLQKGVALKDPNSMRMLAIRLALGQDTAPDMPRAFRLMEDCWFHQRNQLCQVELGKMYEFGIATNGEISSAHLHYKWARGFNGVAEYRLGRFYELGLGVPQNYRRAMEYYMAAAKNYSSGAAMNRLGHMHEKGLGVPVDFLQAAAWYEKAGDFHEASGNVNGGRLYLEGKGVKRDPAEAARWFQEAAERSEPMAMRALASLYASGDGVPLNSALALDLFCKSAIIDQRNAESKLEYSILARPKMETAYRLATLKICGERNPNTGSNAQHLASAVTADVIEQADSLLSRWTKAGSLALAISQDLQVADE
jgi:TPR repeat protein